MLNKLASSFILASALVGTMTASAYAGDDTFKSVCLFPVRVVGSTVGGVAGVPLGAFKDSVKGYSQGTNWVSGKMGNEDGKFNVLVGSLVGGPVGFVGGGAYGMFDGTVHGFKTGYSKPFSKDSWTFKDE